MVYRYRAKMNFSLVIGFVILLFNGLCSSTLDYNNCHFTQTPISIVELFCDKTKLKHFESDCYSVFLSPTPPVTGRPAVDILKFADCEKSMKLINIASSFFDRFPKLRFINMSNLMINRIQLNVNRNTSNYLEIFNASKNNLTEITLMMFKMMPNLIEIDFSSNSITTINAKHFQGATKLKTINLSDNGLRFMEDNPFAMLPNLEYLNLNMNDIQKIDNNLFVKNDNMKHLNLMDNPLKWFDFNAFSSMVNLIELQIHWDQLLSLDISCQRSICPFQQFIDAYMFDNLQIFNASGNHHRNITDVLNRIGLHLQVLDLSGNFIDALSADYFDRFDNLKELTLKHMNITSIQFDQFSKAFSHLEILNLEGNELTAIENVTLGNFPNLKSLAISKNQFPCDYLDEILSQWKNFSKLLLVRNPTSYHINIEGIDCRIVRESVKNIECARSDEITGKWNGTSIDVGSTIGSEKYESTLNVEKNESTTDAVGNINSTNERENKIPTDENINQISNDDEKSDDCSDGMVEKRMNKEWQTAQDIKYAIPIWFYIVLTILSLIVLLEFIVIAIVCCNFRGRNTKYEIPMEAMKIENDTRYKEKRFETNMKNYEEIPLQHTIERVYEVPEWEFHGQSGDIEM